MAFKKRIVRMAVDITAYGGSLADATTQALPSFYYGVGCQIQLMFFVGTPSQGVVADLSLVTAIKLLIADSALGASQYIDKTAVITTTNPTVEDWNAGTDQHATVDFVGAELQLPMGTNTDKAFWLTIHGFTSDAASDPDVFCSGAIRMYADALPTTGQAQASNIIPVGATYDGSGHYSLTTQTGVGYQWNAGANDTGFTNGTDTETTDGFVFLAAGATVQLNGTAGQLVTARVWYPVYLTIENAVAIIASISGTTTGNKIFNGSTNPNSNQTASVGDEYNQIVSAHLVKKWIKVSGNNTNTGWE
jgi:hypothetical protein